MCKRYEQNRHCSQTFLKVCNCQDYTSKVGFQRFNTSANVAIASQPTVDFNAESAPKPKPAPAPAQTKPQGTLPKGFTAKPAPAPQPAKAKGTLPKGF